MSSNKLTARQKVWVWLWDRGGPCHACTVSLSESMDRRLSLFEWWKMRVHLFSCHWCREFKKQATLLREQTRSLAQELDSNRLKSSLALSTKSRERMKSLIRSQSDKS